MHKILSILYLKLNIFPKTSIYEKVVRDELYSHIIADSGAAFVVGNKEPLELLSVSSLKRFASNRKTRCESASIHDLYFRIYR